MEITTAEWGDWYNHRCLCGEIGLVPPSEYETDHWAQHPADRYARDEVTATAGAN